MIKKIYLHENVCERRFIGYEKLIQYLQKNNIEIVNNIGEGECILFFSCGMKVEETAKLINEYEKCQKKFIIYGCASKMLKINLTKEMILIGMKDEEKLDEILGAKIKYNSINIYGGNLQISGRNYTYNQAMQSWDPRLVTPKCRDIYSITISEGCSNKCSYCAIHKATGELRSRPIAEIVSEMKIAIINGYKHFRLQCENSGSYGTDININLGKLLEAIQKINGEFNVDLPDLHPEGFVKNFDSILKFMENKAVYLIHLPIQSGSQKILDAMGRKYNIKDVEKCLDKLYRIYPNSRVGTDIIIGFPGEKEEDYLESYNLVGKYHFSPLYIHGYCDKHGTIASELKNKVDENVKLERIKKMFDTYNYAACYLNNYRELDNI